LHEGVTGSRVISLWADLTIGRSRFHLLQQPRFTKNAPGAAGADGNNVLIQQHERRPPIPLKRIVHSKSNDRFPFPMFKPEVAGDQLVMFVGFAVPLAPMLAEINNGGAFIVLNAPLSRHTINLSLRRKRLHVYLFNKSAVIVFLKGNSQFLLGVHHDRSVPGHGFIERFS